MKNLIQSLEAAAYHHGVEEGVLRLQKCSACCAVRHPPSPMCPQCQSLECHWEQSRGTGTVHSWVTIHYSTLPAFKDRTPYTVLTVSLDDGVRMLAPLDFESTHIPQINERVQLHFLSEADGSHLPVFKAIST